MDEAARLTHILDSEFEEDEEVVWIPEHLRLCAFVREAEQLRRDSLSLAEEREEEQWEHNLVRERREIVTQRFRSFRKRTAIQRNPYKLDRLRHKQLLKGFGLVLREDIEGPLAEEEEKSQTEVEQVMDLHSKDKEWLESVSWEQPELNDLSESQSEGGAPSSSGSEVTHTQDGTCSPEKKIIHYRGKHFNLRSGFRGILPKVAWKAALKGGSSANSSYMRRDRQTGKGVAKRKILKVHYVSGEKSHDSGVDPDILGGHGGHEEKFRAHETDDSLDIQAIKNYFEAKYEKAYAFDGLSDGEETNLPSSSPELSDHNETLKSTEAVDNHNDCVDGFDSDLQILSEADLPRTDSKSTGEIIDPMLNKRRSSFQHPLRAHQGGFDRAQSSKGGTTQSRKSMGRESTRNRSRTHIPTPKKSVRHHRAVPLENQKALQIKAKKAAHCNSNGTKSAREGSVYRKTPSGDVLSNFVTPFFRAAGPVAFETAVEGEGNRFSIVKKPDQHRERSEIERPSEREEYNSSSFEILASAITGIKCNSPDTTEIALSGKSFKLSKFDSNVSQHLQDIFSHLIEKGASDFEVLSMNDAIVRMLSDLDNPGLWIIVDDFHKAFRSKVNILRNRAKPVHFYQIAACQIMLLQVTRYSRTSKIMAQEISGKIVGHTVSFFKLLSKCNGIDIIDKLLINSYEFLSQVAGHIVSPQEFWDKIPTVSFPPKIALLIIRYFPTEKMSWSIAELDNSFNGVTEWLNFVHYCTTRWSWQVDYSLIQKLYDLFKVKKFQNFDEENDADTDRPIYGTLDWKPPFKSVFNAFLDLLKSCPMSVVQLERVTPLGQMVSLNNPVLLVNRINLLSVLATKASTNFESKFEDLCNPYVKREVEKVFAPHKMYEIILTGFCSLLLTNARKGFITKARIVYQIFQQMANGRGLIEDGAMSQFFKRVYALEGEIGKSLPFLLKGLYTAMTLLIKQKKKHELIPMLGFYEKHLHILDTGWVMSHLYQIVGNLANEEDYLYHFHFAVTKFLVSEKAMTWWSVVNYNNFSSTKDQSIPFYTKIIDNCDASSFLQIRHIFLRTAVDYLSQRRDVQFIKFLRALSRRDHTFKIFPTLPFTATHFEIITRTLRALKKVHDDSLITAFIAKLRARQLTAPHAPLIMDVTKFLNTEFVDSMKNNADFLHLKSQFSISEAETQKSLFREILFRLKDETERASYIEEELLNTSSQGQPVQPFIDKLASTFGTGLYSNDYVFFALLTEANVVAGNQWWALLALIQLINRRLATTFCQVSSSEFYGLYRLHLILSQIFSRQNTASISSEAEANFYKELCVFFGQNLKISSGFLEHAKLIAMCEEFLDKSSSNVMVLENQSAWKISNPFLSQVRKQIEKHNLRAFIPMESITSPLAPEVEDYLSKLSAVVRLNRNSTTKSNIR
ncbi:LADA_0C04742g1_1 [Lachancea dasiensis]|uniref:LADA_0C04742g1_1 n=1 Tax=Lachancea dasiensis TaxID=1072105 RepID=A0A1G4IYY2_9SACH|nr:LADA_0C04742g1_1 [Lachancea dasiensis]